MSKFQEIQLAPRIVEAILILQGKEKELKNFCSDIGIVTEVSTRNFMSGNPLTISVKNNKGYIRTGNVGDWIVKDANGHFTIETFLEFAATYRVIEEE